MAVRCRLLGHRYRFTADGAEMSWRCARDGCTAAGSKRYPSAAAAARFAAAFDREDRDEIGRRAPLFGMFPLRIYHRLRTRHAQRSTPPRRRRTID